MYITIEQTQQTLTHSQEMNLQEKKHLKSWTQSTIQATHTFTLLQHIVF